MLLHSKPLEEGEDEHPERPERLKRIFERLQGMPSIRTPSQFMPDTRLIINDARPSQTQKFWRAWSE
jgi:hypothetical protein